MADFAASPPPKPTESTADFFVNAIVATKDGAVTLFDALAERNTATSLKVLASLRYIVENQDDLASDIVKIQTAQLKRRILQAAEATTATRQATLQHDTGMKLKTSDDWKKLVNTLGQKYTADNLPKTAEQYVSEINKLVAQLNVERIDPAMIAEKINKDMSSWLKANEKKYRKNKMVQMPTESNPRPLAAVMQVSTMAGYVPSPTDCGACSMGLP